MDVKPVPALVPGAAEASVTFCKFLTCIPEQLLAQSAPIDGKQPNNCDLQPIVTAILLTVLFDSEFALAIGRDRIERRIFPNRQVRGDTVHRGTGQHNDPWPSRLMTRKLQNFNCGADALAKLCIGIGKGRSYETAARAMNDQVNRLRQGLERMAGHVAELPAAQASLVDFGLGSIAMTDADDAMALRLALSGTAVLDLRTVRSSQMSSSRRADMA